MFPMLNAPKVLYSEYYIFRRFYVSESLCSEGSVLRRFYILKIIYSEGSLFPKIPCSEGFMFLKFYDNKNLRTPELTSQLKKMG